MTAFFHPFSCNSQKCSIGFLCSNRHVAEEIGLLETKGKKRQRDNPIFGPFQKVTVLSDRQLKNEMQTAAKI